MPILGQIELFLDGTYSKEERKAFIFKSRSICNYLERALREREFETLLSRVNIHCSKNAGERSVRPLTGAPFLEVRIKYDLPPLDELDEPSLQRHYAAILGKGLKVAESFMPVPYSFCISTLRRFEEDGFKNEWLQAEKTWGDWRCDVVATLTTERFELWQHIYRGAESVAKRKIAETKPREMLFLDYLGSLSMDRSGNIVYRRKGKALTKFNVESGEFCDVE